ncbi:thymidylate synthase [Brucepastera parasyntrophica]|uniref:thymidylate synthase n=1 Tax=Brucepastera parasyntrophica TaxID=2880008 RepID=UPI00210D9658|nr:thymidylate synthase [Brucepastera parasyntrophica]ULQ58803.1 thymidylate synthase [Brucepastera parasyntrophica]
MKAYLDIVEKVLKLGFKNSNRTGIDALTIPGAFFEHDMKEGFPLLTTKKIPFRLISSELEFFIKGITDKEWLREKNNHIWDEWCSPDIVPYGTSEETKKLMEEERDLGPIYGWQWRHFGAQYAAYNEKPSGKGVDQLQNLVDKLKNRHYDRRMIVSAWNPVDIDRMALPPCHYSFQITVISNRLNLLWNQRSVDVALGLPFNIASYGLLLHLLAIEAGLEEGKLIGFLGDTHIYENHIKGLESQLERTPYALPSIKTDWQGSLFNWKYPDTIVEEYNSHPSIKFEVAV